MQLRRRGILRAAGVAAMAAAVMSVSAMRLSGCGRATLTAVSCFAMVVAIAALAGVVTAAPMRIIGSISALAALGLLEIAAPVSIVMAGLSPRLPPAPGLDAPDRTAAKTIRADTWLTSLLAAFSCSAALGAIVTVLTGAPRISCIAFATATGSLLGPTWPATSGAWAIRRSTAPGQWNRPRST